MRSLQRSEAELSADAEVHDPARDTDDLARRRICLDVLVLAAHGCDSRRDRHTHRVRANARLDETVALREANGLLLADFLSCGLGLLLVAHGAPVVRGSTSHVNGRVARTIADAAGRGIRWPRALRPHRLVLESRDSAGAPSLHPRYGVIRRRGEPCGALELRHCAGCGSCHPHYGATRDTRLAA